MSVTASAVIASTLIVSDGADATVKSEKNVEAPWTVSLKHTPKVKHINASDVLQNRLVKKDSEEEDDSSARASRKASASGTYTVESGDTISEIRSEEHTSELQSRGHLVCRLLLEKKKKNRSIERSTRAN